MTIQNDLLLRKLAREQTSRPPIWFMRQAGRYLPDYQVLKAKYDFFTRVQTPELVAEITNMPVYQIGAVQQSANRQEERTYPHLLQKLDGRYLPQYSRINVNDRRISPLFPAVLFDDGCGNSDHTNP